MLKKIVLTVFTFLLVIPMALADQELNLYNQYCEVKGLNSAVASGFWHNYYGQPSCAVSASHWGTNCAGEYVQIITKNTKCTFTTTYAASSTIIVSPTCSGTIISPLFYVYDSGAASL